MMGEYIYLNNYELGKLTDIEMVVNGNFNVIIGIENKPVNEILKYCDKGKRIWVRRNFEDVLNSQKAHYESQNMGFARLDYKLYESKELDKDYHDYLVNASGINDTIVHYEMWNSDETNRGGFAHVLGLKFNDSNKEKVFGYGKSSFAE